MLQQEQQLEIRDECAQLEEYAEQKVTTQDGWETRVLEK
jgi:hypothetical protein